MRILLPLILLAFPIAELWLLFKLGGMYGWWLLVYLVVVGYLGLQLMKSEKIQMSANLMQTLQAGGNPIKTMMATARNMFAGFLLLIPGVITDFIAVILLLIPIQQANATSGQNRTQHQSPYQSASNDDVIEGEYTEIKEDTNNTHGKLK
jgi:UPF0716 protein FxsA